MNILVCLIVRDALKTYGEVASCFFSNVENLWLVLHLNNCLGGFPF